MELSERRRYTISKKELFFYGNVWNCRKGRDTPKNIKKMKNAVKPATENALSRFCSPKNGTVGGCYYTPPNLKSKFLKKEKEYYCKLRFKSFKYSSRAMLKIPLKDIFSPRIK